MRLARACKAALLLGLMAPIVHAKAQGGPIDSLTWRAASIARANAGATELAWPGYRFEPEFLLCARDGSVLLVSSSVPPAAFGEFSPVRLQGEEHPNAYLFQQPPLGLPSHCTALRFAVGEKRVIAFPAIDSLYGTKSPVAATVILLFHEQFHRYQAEHFAETRGTDPRWRYHALEAALAPPDSVVHSSLFRARAAEERYLLSRALREPRRDSLRSLLSRYLSVRANRTSMLPPDFQGSEAHEERKEGSAQIVSYRAALQALGQSDSALVELVQWDLLNTPDFQSTAWRLGAFRQWHIYATGAAIALLLDRLNVPWREDLQRGATFVDILRTVVG